MNVFSGFRRKLGIAIGPTKLRQLFRPIVGDGGKRRVEGIRHDKVIFALCSLKDNRNRQLRMVKLPKDFSKANLRIPAASKVGRLIITVVEIHSVGGSLARER